MTTFSELIERVNAINFSNGKFCGIINQFRL